MTFSGNFTFNKCSGNCALSGWRIISCVQADKPSLGELCVGKVPAGHRQGLGLRNMIVVGLDHQGNVPHTFSALTGKWLCTFCGSVSGCEHPVCKCLHEHWCWLKHSLKEQGMRLVTPLDNGIEHWFLKVLKKYSNSGASKRAKNIGLVSFGIQTTGFWFLTLWSKTRLLQNYSHLRLVWSLFQIQQFLLFFLQSPHKYLCYLDYHTEEYQNWERQGK